MPRRGRSSPMRAPAAPKTAMRAPAASRTAPPPQVPARTSSQPMYVAPQTQQPSMFKQMAATAGGVAVGSAVGHVAGAAMMGGLSGTSTQNQEPDPQQPMYDQMANTASEQPYYGAQRNQPSGPCAWEISQFLNCAQGQGAYDITLCEGFNEALRQCKRANAYN